MENEEIFKQVVKILKSTELQLQEFNVPEVNSVIHTLIGSLHSGHVGQFANLAQCFSQIELNNIMEIQKLKQQYGDEL